MAKEQLPEETIIATAKIMENTSFSMNHTEELPTYDNQGEQNAKLKQFSSIKVIPTYRGVQQGSVISPSLFSIYMAPLLRKLEKVTDCAMAYADDLAFTCVSREKLKKTLAITEEWCQTTGMEINKEKSAIMRIRKDRRTRGVEHGSGEDTIMGFPVKTQYKYLGVMIEDTMEVNKDNASHKEGNRIARKLGRIF